MNKKKSVILCISFIVIIVIILIAVYLNNKGNQENQNDTEQANAQNETSNATVEELMQNVNATANSDIYEIQTEYDGREVLVVKPSLQFCVAFAGSINKNLASIEEAQTITEQNLPQDTGIYVGNSENKVLEYINEYTNSQYGVSDKGYLVLKESKENNDIDNRIQKVMNSDYLYIVYCDGTMKNIDNITGEILNYDFEDMDPYQAYEYCQDENRFFIELTTNKENRLSQEEIFMAFLELLELNL